MFRTFLQIRASKRKYINAYQQKTEKIVVYSHNGIQNINTNKQTLSTCDNINGFQK